MCIRDRFEAGLKNRRRVLGDAWVDRSLANRTPFNAEFQAMITRIAWQEIWSRPGLDDRTRRLLVLAITASLGRWEEFRLHVRAGLTRGGFTRDDLKAVSYTHLDVYKRQGLEGRYRRQSRLSEDRAELQSEHGDRRQGDRGRG